ncbi:unnamed protein product [Parajaminaea phylloscopi]
MHLAYGPVCLLLAGATRCIALHASGPRLATGARAAALVQSRSHDNKTESASANLGLLSAPLVNVTSDGIAVQTQPVAGLPSGADLWNSPSSASDKVPEKQTIDTSRQGSDHAALPTAVTPVYSLDDSFVIDDIPRTRSYDFTLTRALASPDGYEKEVYAINGMMPGPLIEANVGDTIEVVVHNQLEETTSIHWHGILQNGTADMDGAPGFTSCPIMAGGTHTYRYLIAHHDPGTYWWHSHSGGQYTDGLLGPMVIHAAEESFARGKAYDSEVVLLIQDWYHNQSADIMADLISTKGYLGSPAAPSPQSNLINGQGVFDCSLLTTDETKCITPSVRPSMVVGRERVRFRFINGGSHAQQMVSIDSITLTVMSVDATSSREILVQRVPIHNGQRYDAIVDFRNVTEGSSYWLRAEMNTKCFAYVDPNLNTTALVAIHVGSDKAREPTAAPWAGNMTADCADLSDDDLAPVVIEDAPDNTDHTAVGIFNSHFGVMSRPEGNYSRFFFNGTSLVNPIYQPFMASIANGSVINSTYVASAEASDHQWVYDIVINNRDKFLDHPFHLHGHGFYIVGRGKGALTLKEWMVLPFNTSNPPRRDTVNIPGEHYAVLRVNASNPGVWPLHCHIAFHIAQGFMAALVVHPEAIKSRGLWTESDQALCNAGLAAGASINDTEFPRVPPMLPTLPARP